MEDKAGVLFLFMLATSVALGGLALIFWSECEQFKDEAVRRGAARWVEGENGRKIFKWGAVPPF